MLRLCAFNTVERYKGETKLAASVLIVGVQFFSLLRVFVTVNEAYAVTTADQRCPRDTELSMHEGGIGAVVKRQKR